MATRPIAPAPPRFIEHKSFPIQTKFPDSRQTNVSRGKADISISTTGILNPEPQSPPPKVKTAKPVVKTPTDKTEFAFVNISKPSQASSRENKRFVKSFVS